MSEGIPPWFGLSGSPLVDPFGRPELSRDAFKTALEDARSDVRDTWEAARLGWVAIALMLGTASWFKRALRDPSVMSRPLSSESDDPELESLLDSSSDSLLESAASSEVSESSSFAPVHKTSATPKYN